MSGTNGMDDDAAPVTGCGVTCVRCGVAAPSDPPPVTWSGGTERGRLTYVCPGCARDNLRSIEGKLDESWW